MSMLDIGLGRRLSIVLAIAMAGWAAPLRAGDDHQHAGDFVVGRTGAGQLNVEFDFDEHIALPAVQSLLFGWAGNEPGFMSLDLDEPAEDFFTLASGAHIVFEVVSFSPALQAWTPPGLSGPLLVSGDSWVLGGSVFDEHLTWHIDSTSPSFDPFAGPWLAAFRLVDVGTTGYLPSAEFTVAFVPEPSTVLLLLAIGAGALLCRAARNGRRADRILFQCQVLLAAAICSGTPAVAQHAGDIWVGRSGAGQLKIGGADLSQFITLEPVTGLLEGWTLNHPGFDGVQVSDAGSNLFTMSPGAEISLILVQADPAFRVIDASFGVLEFSGDETFLGDQQLHTHVIWQVDADAPAFDPFQCLWEARFKLIDDGPTNYSDSDSFTMKFTLSFDGQPDGDFDRDADVELDDYSLFVHCMTGPNATGGGCMSVCHGVFDFDGDGDIDLRDYRTMVNILE